MKRYTATPRPISIHVWARLNEILLKALKYTPDSRNSPQTRFIFGRWFLIFSSYPILKSSRSRSLAFPTSINYFSPFCLFILVFIFKKINQPLKHKTQNIVLLILFVFLRPFSPYARDDINLRECQLDTKSSNFLSRMIRTEIYILLLVNLLEYIIRNVNVMYAWNRAY